MRDVEQFSSLVADIYDAALDSSLWIAALGKARRFIGGQAATLFCKDAVGKSGNACYQDGGLDPHYAQLYFDNYVELDPSTTVQFFAEIEKLLSTADFAAYDAFLETRFYKEWVRPQGIVDFVSAALDKSVPRAAMFGVFRHKRDGLVDDETRRRMRLIVPHMRRAVLIDRAIDLKTAEAATLADALDGLSAGMCLVDETGRIVHANVSGHGMLKQGSVLRAPGGKLAANEPNAAQALNETFARAGGGDAAVGVKGIAVPLTDRDGECYVAHVLPLTSGTRRRAGASHAAVAALFVHKATLDTPSPPEVIGKTFKLTPSELRVLLAIVQGRAGDGGGAGHHRADGQDTSAPSVRQDRHRPLGRAGQAGRRVFQSPRRLSNFFAR